MAALMDETSRASDSELDRLLALRSAPGLAPSVGDQRSAVILWEEIRSVAFDPKSSRLQAVVNIKNATGYCLRSGSEEPNEHVRFFIDAGSGFRDAGTTAFRAFDTPDCVIPEHPYSYFVQHEVPPSVRDELDPEPQDGVRQATVRAVLSWNQQPSDDPEALPLFGNRVEAQIQLERQTVANSSVVPRIPAVSISAGNLAVQPQAVGAAVGVARARDPHYVDIPLHRHAYPAVQRLFHAGAIPEVPYTGTSVNLDEVLAVAGATKASTEFEELTSVGLCAATDSVGATIWVKKPRGYSEGSGSAGTEYVAFWADCNNDGVFEEYLGMTSIEVRDREGTIPAGGLWYSVAVPVSNSLRVLRARGIFKSVRIRGVLSWMLPPSISDPNALTPWGNRAEAQVRLNPAPVVPEKPRHAERDFLSWLAQLKPSARRRDHSVQPPAADGAGLLQMSAPADEPDPASPRERSKPRRQDS